MYFLKKIILLVCLLHNAFGAPSGSIPSHFISQPLRFNVEKESLPDSLRLSGGSNYQPAFLSTDAIQEKNLSDLPSAVDNKSQSIPEILTGNTFESDLSKGTNVKSNEAIFIKKSELVEFGAASVPRQQTGILNGNSYLPLRSPKDINQRTSSPNIVPINEERNAAQGTNKKEIEPKIIPKLNDSQASFTEKDALFRDSLSEKSCIIDPTKGNLEILSNASEHDNSSDEILSETHEIPDETLSTLGQNERFPPTANIAPESITKKNSETPTVPKKAQISTEDKASVTTQSKTFGTKTVINSIKKLAINHQFPAEILDSAATEQKPVPAPKTEQTLYETLADNSEELKESAGVPLPIPKELPILYETPEETDVAASKTVELTPNVAIPKENLNVLYETPLSTENNESELLEQSPSVSVPEELTNFYETSEGTDADNTQTAVEHNLRVPVPEEDLPILYDPPLDTNHVNSEVLELKPVDHKPLVETLENLATFYETPQNFKSDSLNKEQKHSVSITEDFPRSLQAKNEFESKPEQRQFPSKESLKPEITEEIRGDSSQVSQIAIDIPVPSEDLLRLYDLPNGDSISADDSNTQEQRIKPPTKDEYPEESVSDESVLSLPTLLSGKATSNSKGTMMGMPFNFKYAVADPDNGNMFSHNAESDGTVTRGEYSVLLPDGRLQIVQFRDEGNGFIANIRYEDHPAFKTTQAL